jgi:hypothetical protein
MEYKAIIEKAIADAKLAAQLAIDNHEWSNGSEAWQAVIVRPGRNRKLINALKELGYSKDSYWGWVLRTECESSYWGEEAYANTLASLLSKQEISAHPVQRLL